MRIEKSAGWLDVGLKVDSGRHSRYDEIEARQVAIGYGQYASTISRSEARQVALALALGPEGSEHAGGTEAVDNGQGSVGTGRAWLPVARVAASDVVTLMTRSVGYWAISGDGLRPVLRHRDEVTEVQATVYPPDSASGPLRIKVRAVPSTVPVGTSTRLPGAVIVRDTWGAFVRTFQTLKGGKERHNRAADRRVAEAARKAARTPEQVEADRAADRASAAARRAARTPERVEADRLAERVRDASRRDAAKQAQALALLADGGAMRA